VFIGVEVGQLLEVVDKVFHLFLCSLRLLCGDTINAVCNRIALRIRLEDDVACASPDSVFKDFAGGLKAERFGRFGLWQGRLIFIGGDKRYAFGCGGELLFFIDEDSSDVVSGKHAFEISDPCVSVDDVCHGNRATKTANFIGEMYPPYSVAAANKIVIRCSQVSGFS